MSLTNPLLNARAQTWEEVFFRPSLTFVVPKYQRQYSWPKDMINEFWEDLNTREKLFVGTVKNISLKILK